MNPVVSYHPSSRYNAQGLSFSTANLRSRTSTSNSASTFGPSRAASRLKSRCILFFPISGRATKYMKLPIPNREMDMNMMNFLKPGSFRRPLERGEKLSPFLSPYWLLYQHHSPSTGHIDEILTFWYPYLWSFGRSGRKL
jgi:hypothetical protein